MISVRSGEPNSIRYHEPTRRITLRVSIDGEAIPQLTATGQAIMTARGLVTPPRNIKNPPTAMPSGAYDPFSCRTCPRQDSNLRSRLRRAVLYPLSYGGSVTEKEYQGSDRWVWWASGRGGGRSEQRAKLAF